MSNGEELLEGFKQFREEAYEGDCTLMEQLIAQGQDPEYFLISCIDSRANPGAIFRPKPGTFFGHKAMGAIVRPYKKGTALGAALQYALAYNDTKTIIVLGHTGCGAVKALVEGIEDDDIASFVEVAKQSICGSLRETEENIVLQSVKNLRQYPSVAKALTENRVTIKPWLFDMEEGAILEYCTETKEFSPINLP